MTNEQRKSLQTEITKQQEYKYEIIDMMLDAAIKVADR